MSFKSAADLSSLPSKHGVHIVKTFQNPDNISGPQVIISWSKKGVVNFEGDVLVATANSMCVGGGALDEAINNAGGEVLLEARKQLPIVAKPFIRYIYIYICISRMIN